MRKILCVVGTRPEAIKMAPIILALKQEDWAEVRVLATAQHREMLDQVLSLFAITPNIDLDIMQSGQTLPELTSRLITALDNTFEAENPFAVLAQGDTTTVFVTALACFYRKIFFGHVEAGLRTGNMYYPFPEEVNRKLAGHLANLHFAPTNRSRDALLRENISENNIALTGNTVIDSLLYIAKKKIPIGIDLDPQKKLILVTAHRRENFGSPFVEVLRAIRHIAETHKDVQILYPVHPNPNVSEPAKQYLSDCPGVILCEPLSYGPFVSAMKKAYLILTDSGGIQEEAPALSKPVLVLREETERPEAVEEGVVKLVGANFDKIVSEVDRLLTDQEVYRSMARGVSPYGDGKAAARIVESLKGLT
jgi:UDP-N-acetylglucosamine 2-epimerase (non-hydrolysing)